MFLLSLITLHLLSDATDKFLFSFFTMTCILVMLVVMTFLEVAT